MAGPCEMAECAGDDHVQVHFDVDTHFPSMCHDGQMIDEMMLFSYPIYAYICCADG